MTDENPKITTVKKEKDPKKQEAGRKLAAISQQAKEKKMRERIVEEMKQAEKENNWNIDYRYLIGLIVLLIIYFGYNKSPNDSKNKNKELYKNDPHNNEDSKNIGDSKNIEEPSFKFDSLD